MKRLVYSAVLTALAMPAGAQVEYREDAATGAFLVTAYDDDLRPVELRVMPGDLVHATVTPLVARLPDSRLRYEYDVRLTPDSRQPLRTIYVACPLGGNEQQEMSADLANAGALSRRLAPRWRDWPDQGACSVSLGAAPLDQTDGIVRFAISTTSLPSIGLIRLAGDSDDVLWPASDPIPENDAAREFVWHLRDTRRWVVLPGVVPARSATDYTTAQPLMSALRRDLAAACAVNLSWIDHRGICNSLGVKLAQAARSLEAGQGHVAASQVRAFVQELEAQRGNHVGENAYWLLAIMAERLLEVI